MQSLKEGKVVILDGNDRTSAAVFTAVKKAHVVLAEDKHGHYVLVKSRWDEPKYKLNILDGRTVSSAIVEA